MGFDFFGNIENLWNDIKDPLSVVSPLAAIANPGGIGRVWNDVTGLTASDQATQALQDSTNQAIEFQQQALDTQREDLSPYTEAGAAALQQQQALMGALGQDAQQQALQGIQQGSQFQAMQQQGENAILQNASATGGLRGGNTQAALGQFRPQLLNQLVNQRFNQLGGLAGMGQASAAGVGQAGQQGAANIGNLLGQQGQANAANQLNQYALQKGAVTDLIGLGTQIATGGF
jgi:hypothetical protein